MTATLRMLCAAAVLVTAVGAAAGPTERGLSRHVLVVANEAVPLSGELAQRYAEARGIPAANVVRLRVSSGDEITRDEYVRTIESPLVTWFNRERLHDRIHFIVLIKGMPLRVSGTPGREGTAASVDSELSLLYRKMVHGAHPLSGRVANPYFLDQRDIAAAAPFSREVHDIFLVTRLDGYTGQDVVALIERGARPQRGGAIVLEPGGGTSPVERTGDTWIAAAAERLRALPSADAAPIVVDNSTPEAARAVIGHASWGGGDAGKRRMAAKPTFVPGAIAATFGGANARTFREPAADRPPAGSGDPLLADLVREGVTGAGGGVAELYLDGVVRPDILLPAYVAGFNLAEAFYLALPSLSWQNVIVGDPLCAPFGKPDAPPEPSEPPLDPSTELPAVFSRRRLSALQSTNVDGKALALFLRAESREARGDSAGAVAALEEAIAAAPSFLQAYLVLAGIRERLGDTAGATLAYRRILALDARQVIALNNLSLQLAARGEHDEALTLAQKAYALAPRSADVADTLGWIHHLRGNHADALRLIGDAAKRAPNSAEIRLHAAIVFEAAGDRDRAQQELAAALDLNPSLAGRADVTALRQRLRRPPGAAQR